MNLSTTAKNNYLIRHEFMGPFGDFSKSASSDASNLSSQEDQKRSVPIPILGLNTNECKHYSTGQNPWNYTAVC
jgi:hypothetical protein